MRQEKLLILAIIAMTSSCFADSVRVIRNLPEQIYNCPFKESYSAREVHFDTQQTPMVLVVPECVTNIDRAAFTGARQGTSGNAYYYHEISNSGISDVFFLGRCPSVTTFYIGGVWYYAVGHYEGSTFVTTKGEFFSCTIWYEEGQHGWTNGMNFCGGVVRPGAARVVIHPSSSSGDFFYTDRQYVSMTCDNPDATIYYTLDGTEPTTDSMVYSSPVGIEGDTVVKTMAVVPTYPFAIISSQSYKWHITETPIITPSTATFANTSQSVQISCADDGAEIWYSTDGSDPIKNGHIYTRPLEIYESCTLRVVAQKKGKNASPEVMAVFTRTEELSEAVNLYGYLMETDASNPWTVVTDVSHDGVSCVRSGTIGHGGMTWLQTSVRKAGTVSFWWKAACEEAEEEDGETYWYDYGSFLVDGVVKAQIAGNDTGWQFVSVDVPSGGKHTLRWEYTKDDATTYSPDCIWLDQVQWIPADGSGHTLTTPDPVPYSWLSSYGLGLDSDFESAAKQSIGKQSGNGRTWQVWQDYVAGTDPTNVTSAFTASIEMKDGMPLVTWSPNLNSNGEVRVYTVMGKEKLTDAVWQSPTNSTHRFFKVKVELP